MCYHTYIHPCFGSSSFSPVLSKTHMVNPFLNVLFVNNTIRESFGVVDIVVLNMNMFESFIPSSTHICQVFNPWLFYFFSCLNSQPKQSTRPHQSSFNLKTNHSTYSNGRKREMIYQPSVSPNYVFFFRTIPTNCPTLLQIDQIILRLVSCSAWIHLPFGYKLT